MTKIPLDKYTGKKNRRYTISTLIFDSLEDVQYQLEKWRNKGTLDAGSRIFEVVKEIGWDSDIKIHDCDEEDCEIW